MIALTSNCDSESDHGLGLTLWHLLRNDFSGCSLISLQNASEPLQYNSALP